MLGTDKQHFGMDEWVDFVNEQLSTERKDTMQRHLDTDCGKCAKTAELWHHVRQAAKRESSYEVPESAIRHVRNAFIVTQPLDTIRRFNIPRLVFDSLWQPATVGIRSAASVPRQLIYKAGEISIEMQMQPEPCSERVSVAGQISNSARHGEGIEEIQVIITRSNQKLAETSTNRFGEFHLSFVPEPGARILFGVAGQTDLSVPLDGRDVAIFYKN